MATLFFDKPLTLSVDRELRGIAEYRRQRYHKHYHNVLYIELARPDEEVACSSSPH